MNNYLRQQPCSYLDKDTIQKKIRQDIKCIISDYYDTTNSDNDEYHININGILVSKKFYDIGFNEEYLNTDIKNKIVYAPILYQLNSLPLSSQRKYLVYDYNEGSYAPNIEIETNNYYCRVEFEEEETLFDLYSNFYKYYYNIKSKTYKRLPEEKYIENLSEQYLNNRLFHRYIGNEIKYIRYLQKLISWLISKIDLSDEDKDKIKPILETYCVPNDNDLNDIVSKINNIENTLYNELYVLKNQK